MELWQHGASAELPSHIATATGIHTRVTATTQLYPYITATVQPRLRPESRLQSGLHPLLSVEHLPFLLLLHMSLRVLCIAWRFATTTLFRMTCFHLGGVRGLDDLISFVFRDTLMLTAGLGRPFAFAGKTF
jgi:hypothetical protein